jgi:hypothetical protein
MVMRDTAVRSTLGYRVTDSYVARAEAADPLDRDDHHGSAAKETLEGVKETLTGVKDAITGVGHENKETAKDATGVTHGEVCWVVDLLTRCLQQEHGSVKDGYDRRLHVDACLRSLILCLHHKNFM